MRGAGGKTPLCTDDNFIRKFTRPYAGIFSWGEGGQDYLEYSMGKASEGVNRLSGWGGGGGGGEDDVGGGVPLPHEGAFAFLRLKLNDLVHTLGGIFGKFSIKQ